MTETTSPTPDSPTDAAEAAPKTLRVRLRDRRQESVDQLFTDRDVPRLPGVVVRFKPLPGGTVNDINAKTDKSKDPERFVRGAAESLAFACMGIYDVTDDEDAAIERTRDGRLLISIDADHPDQPAPKFDQRLADLLGLAHQARAIDVVRGLYLTDGDVVAESNALTIWSGFAGEKAAEEYAGN